MFLEFIKKSEKKVVVVEETTQLVYHVGTHNFDPRLFIERFQNKLVELSDIGVKIEEVIICEQHYKELRNYVRLYMLIPHSGSVDFNMLFGVNIKVI